MPDAALHVLHLNNRLEAGGVRRYIIDLSRGLIDRGCRVTVAACGASAETVPDGIRCIDLPLYTSGGMKSPAGFLRSSSALRRLLRDVGADVLHVHGRYATLLAHALPAAIRPPAVYTAHNIFRDLRFLPWYPRDVICPARTTERAFLDGVTNAAAFRTHVIRHGIDASLCVPREPLSPPLTFTFAGRHVAEKGGELLLRAAGELASIAPEGWRLCFLGDGPLRPRWQALASSLGIGRLVRFGGHMPDMLDALRHSAALVVPSLEKEGFGYVLLDAACAGAPVIASDLPLFREMLEEGIPGMLFETGNSSALAGAMLELLQRGGELPASCARVFEPGHFSMSLMVEGTLDVYRRAIADA
jgi:glycosyltransferase involved in cell wall biosynthesis